MTSARKRWGDYGGNDNMKNIIVAMGLCALALAGCSQSEQTKQPEGLEGITKTQGGVEFNVEVDGYTINELQLTIMCPGINQSHLLDISSGSAVAAFGGLQPGLCTVSFSGTTDPDGYPCTGDGDFEIVAGQVAEPDPFLVTCTLPGNGVDQNPGGGVKIDTEIVVEGGGDCPSPRIAKIYAIPSNLPAGGSTEVHVETVDTVGAVSISYEDVQNPPDYVGDLSFADCDPASDDCALVTCQSGGLVWVEVTVVDDQCTDIERVWVECGGDVVEPLCGNGMLDGDEACDGDAGLMAGQVCGDDCQIVPTCGNDIVESDEGCDDGNLDNGDGCDENCVVETVETCGDGVCDASIGEDKTTCPADCTVVETCGDGVCDASIGEDETTCPADCTVVETCGDGVCDAAIGEDSTTCPADCQATGTCYDCLSAPPIDELTFGFCDPTANTLCDAVLQCYITTECWAQGETPAECYCGAGVISNDCEAPAFTPQGVCAAEIIAAAGGDSPDNATILARFSDPSFDLGWAGQIMTTAQSFCTAECNFPQ